MPRLLLPITKGVFRKRKLRSSSKMQKNTKIKIRNLEKGYKPRIVLKDSA